jgi:hypothetical protein
MGVPGTVGVISDEGGILGEVIVGDGGAGLLVDQLVIDCARPTDGQGQK